MPKLRTVASYEAIFVINSTYTGLDAG